jgi:hypothetical protein
MKNNLKKKMSIISQAYSVGVRSGLKRINLSNNRSLRTAGNRISKIKCFTIFFYRSVFFFFLQKIEDYSVQVFRLIHFVVNQLSNKFKSGLCQCQFSKQVSPLFIQYF